MKIRLMLSTTIGLIIIVAFVIAFNYRAFSANPSEKPPKGYLKSGPSANTFRSVMKNGRLHKEYLRIHPGMEEPPQSYLKNNYYTLRNANVSKGTDRTGFDIPVQLPVLEYSPNSTPVIVEIPGDTLLAVWGEMNRILRSTSADSGLTWTYPQEVILLEYSAPMNGRLIRTQSGDIWYFYRAYVYDATGSTSAILGISSSDNGITWSEPLQITDMDERVRNPAPVELPDGTLQLYYIVRFSPPDGNIAMRESSDGGQSWGTPLTIIDSPSDEYSCSVVNDSFGTIWLFYSSDSLGNFDIWFTTSDDGGATWISPDTLIASPLDERQSAALVDTAGIIWIAYTRFDTTNFTAAHPFIVEGNIYLVNTTNGGSSWEDYGKFTRFTGPDYSPRLFIPFDNFILTWMSYRWGTYLYSTSGWLARIGESVDSEPPPYLHHIETTLLPNRPVPVRAYVSDDSGITDVKLTLTVDYQPQPDIQMYDDGAHDDSLSGDNVWGALIGPLSMGSFIGFAAEITDIQGNQMGTGWRSMETPILQDPGNVALRFGDDASMGGLFRGSWLGFGAEYPTGSGNNYLFFGALWIGAWVDGAPIVSSTEYTYPEWMPDFGTTLEVDSVVSDLDITMKLRDIRAFPPLDLQVVQTSYAWSDSTYDDFIMIQYSVINDGASGTLDSLFIAWWMDFDVPSNVTGEWADDMAGFDDSRNLLYMFDSDSTVSTHIGVMLLDSHNGLFTAMAYAWYEPSTDEERYDHLTMGMFPLPADPADMRVILSAGPDRLEPMDTLTAVVGIVLGYGLDGLQVNADAMLEKYQQISTGLPGYDFDPIPRAFSLHQNYPNPFNPVTEITYSLPAAGHTKLVIYNILGKEVTRLVDSFQLPGRHNIRWDAGDVASGVYFYRLQASDFIQTKKMVLLK